MTKYLWTVAITILVVIVLTIVGMWYFTGLSPTSYWQRAQQREQERKELLVEKEQLQKKYEDQIRLANESEAELSNWRKLAEVRAGDWKKALQAIEQARIEYEKDKLQREVEGQSLSADELNAKLRMELCEAGILKSKDCPKPSGNR